MIGQRTMTSTTMAYFQLWKFNWVTDTTTKRTAVLNLRMFLIGLFMCEEIDTFDKPNRHTRLNGLERIHRLNNKKSVMGAMSSSVQIPLVTAVKQENVANNSIIVVNWMFHSMNGKLFNWRQNNKNSFTCTIVRIHMQLLWPISHNSIVQNLKPSWQIFCLQKRRAKLKLL